MVGMDYWLIRTGPENKSVGGGMYKKTSNDELPRNYVQVDKIGGTVELFKRGGGKEVVRKQEVPGRGWSFIGLDPEGNLIGLYEAARRRPRRRKRSAKK